MSYTVDLARDRYIQNTIKQKQEPATKQTKKRKKKKLSNPKLSGSKKSLISKKAMKSKRILKPSRITVKIKEHTPAEYVPIYFKEEWEEAKRSMFFK